MDLDAERRGGARSDAARVLELPLSSERVEQREMPPKRRLRCASLALLAAGALALSVLFPCGSLAQTATAAPSAASEKENGAFGEGSRSIGLARFRANSPHLRIAEMMQALKDGNMTAQEFFKGMEPLRTQDGKMVNMVTVNEVKTILAEAGDATTAEVLGARNSLGGTPVEAALLGYRWNLTMEAIRAAAADPRIRALARASESSKVFLAMVGTVKSPEALQLSNDIDFSFIGGNPTLLIAMRDFVNAYFIRETGLSMERIDSLGTAHGMGTADVYAGKAGRKYGDSELAKGMLGLLDLISGTLQENAIDGTAAILETLVEQEGRLWKSSNGANDLDKAIAEIEKSGKVEPLLSMEFARHLVRDIIRQSGSMTAMDCIAKGCKYMGRSNEFTTKETGQGASDQALADFAEKLTKVKKTKGPADMAAVIMEYFLASGMASSPFEVDYVPSETGLDKAKLKENRAKATAFLEICLKQIWENVGKGLDARTTHIRAKLKDLEGKDAKSEAAKDFSREMTDLLAELKNELSVFQKDGVAIPADTKAKWEGLLKLVQESAGKGGGKGLTAEQLKQLELVRKLLAGEVSETTLDFARAALTDLTEKVMKVNASLDFIDDTLLGPLRGDPSFEQWVADLKQVKMMQADPKSITDPASRQQLEAFQGQFTVKCRKYTFGVEQKLNQALYGNCIAKGVKKMNMTANAFIQSSQSGRAAMSGLTAFNLANEFSAYAEAMARGDFRDLAAEIIRRRVPFGSAAEAAYQGRYLRATWDTFTTIFPPAGLPEAAYGVVEYATTAAVGALWSADLEALINDLYASAVFEPLEPKPGQEVTKYSLVSVEYGKKVFKREPLIKGDEFILNPDVDLTLWVNLAQNDPFLDLMTEYQNSPILSDMVKGRFALKYETRWRALKRAFVEDMIAKLEKRKNSQVIVDTGKLPALYDELMDVADQLEIRGKLEETMVEEWDSGNLTAMWTWLKNTGRQGLWGGSLSETEKNKWVTVVTSYLETYKKVVERRGAVEAYVSDYVTQSGLPEPPVTQHNQRLLTGIAFLRGKRALDAAAGEYWPLFCERLKDGVEGELRGIKAQAVPDAKLDTEFDRKMAGKVFFEDLWIEALGKMKEPAIGKALTKGFTGGGYAVERKERMAKRTDLVKEFERHYAIASGTVNVRVFQLRDGKKTGEPISTADVKIRDESSRESVVPFKTDAEYSVQGVAPGKYTVLVSASGFKTSDGKDTESRVLTVPKPTETSAPLLPMNFYLAPKTNASPDELAVFVSVDPASGTIRASGSDSFAILKAAAVPKADSGTLRYQWSTADGEVLAQGEGVSRAVLSGAGKAGKDVAVTVFVTDAMQREGTTSCRIKVVSGDALEVKFNDHRTEIFRDQSELVKVEQPIGGPDDNTYDWLITDETGKTVFDKNRWDRMVMINGGEKFPGKTLTIKVTATHRDGQKGQGETRVAIKDEDAPTKLEVKLDPPRATIREDESVELTVTVVPFKDSGRITLNNGDVLPPGQTQYRTRFSGQGRQGEVSVEVVAVDERGRQGQAESLIQVTKKPVGKEPALWIFCLGCKANYHGVYATLQNVPGTCPKCGKGLADGGNAEWVQPWYEYCEYLPGKYRKECTGKSEVQTNTATTGTVNLPPTGPAKTAGATPDGTVPSNSLASAQWVLAKTEDSGPTAGGPRPLQATVKGNVLSIGEEWKASINMYEPPKAMAYGSRHTVNFTFSRAGHSGVSGDWGFCFNDISWDGGGMGPRWGDFDCFMMTGKMSWQVAKAGDGMTGRLVCLYDYGYTDKYNWGTSDRQGSSFTRMFTYELRATNAVEDAGPLTVVLTCSDAVLMPGRVYEVAAKVSGGKPPYSYAWSGPHSGSGAAVYFNPDKAGTYTLAVDVADTKKNTGKASISLKVSGVEVALIGAPTDPIVLGSKVRLSAQVTSGGQPAKGNYVVRWQPHPEVAFEPFESEKRNTTATFEKLGTFQVWVVVQERNGETLTTVAESPQSELRVVAPKLTLAVLPATAYVGQEVKVVAKEIPAVADNLISFWWELKGEALNPGPLENEREYTLRPKSAKPCIVVCHAKSVVNGDELAVEQVEIAAKSFPVNVKVVEKGVTPRVYDPVRKEFVDAPKGAHAIDERIQLEANIEGYNGQGDVRWKWTVNEGTTLGIDTSRTPTVSRHEPGTIDASVQAMDGEGVVLGQGSISVPVSDESGQAVPLRVAVTVDRQTIKSGESVLAKAAAKGGAAPYSFEWAEPFPGRSDSKQVTGGRAGDLRVAVTVKDAKGKTAVGSATLKVVPVVLDVALSADSLSHKAGDTAKLSARAGGGLEPYTYAWKPEQVKGGGAQAEFGTFQSGPAVVSVEVTDKYGNSGRAQVTLQVAAATARIEGLRATEVLGAGRALAVVTAATQPWKAAFHSEPAIGISAAASDGAATISFDKRGTVRVWAEVQKQQGTGVVAIARTPDYAVTVVEPKFNLTFAPAKAQVGQEVEARLVVEPAGADLTGWDIVWTGPGNLKAMGATARFAAEDTKPFAVTAAVNDKTSKATVGRANKAFTADPLQLSLEVVAAAGQGQAPGPATGKAASAAPAVSTHRFNEPVTVKAVLPPTLKAAGVHFTWTVTDGKIVKPSKDPQVTVLGKVGKCTVAARATSAAGTLIGSGTVSFNVSPFESKDAKEGAAVADDKVRKLVSEGEAFEKAGELAKAVATYREAQALKDDPAISARIAELDARIARKAKAAEWLAKGNQFERAKRWKEALACYEAAQTENSDPSVALRIRYVKTQIPAGSSDPVPPPSTPPQHP